MKSGLRFNMGDIESSFLFDSDNAEALYEKVNNNISAVLRYSTRHWTHHLPSPQLVNTENLRICISEFLQIRVLFWIEAMNLLEFRNQCASTCAQVGVEGTNHMVLIQLLMLFFSAGTIILNRCMIFKKLLISLRISLEAQVPNRHHTYTFRP